MNEFTTAEKLGKKAAKVDNEINAFDMANQPEEAVRSFWAGYNSKSEQVRVNITDVEDEKKKSNVGKTVAFFVAGLGAGIIINELQLDLYVRDRFRSAKKRTISFFIS